MENQTIDVQPTAYPFADYDAKAAPVPATGNRIAKCLYRADSAEKHSNSYIELRAFTEQDVTENMTLLMDHVIDYLHTVQDGIIKKYHKDGFSEVIASAVSMSAVIDKLEESGNGRLNREQVFSWFDSAMRDSLTVAFADKLGLSDDPSEAEAEKLEAIVSTYRTRYGALAGNNSHFVPEECEKLQAAIVATGADATPIGSRFVARLDKMQQPDNDLLLSL